MQNNKMVNLNFYKFITLKLVNDELYPHYQYGKNFSLKEIKKFWRKTIKAILAKKAPQKLGLYIHIPFCRQKCSFCFCDSFTPFSYQEVRAYLKILKREINIFKNIFEPVSFTSVYFGGGSPSFLKPKDLKSLFQYIYQSFKLTPDSQIIFEGTPTDLNKDILSILAKYGVNRLTIGVQSLDPKVIKLMRRPQTKESFIKVFESARKLGIPYINIDLIAGLEKQSIQSFVSDLKLVLKLGADMVHVTGFTPLSHTLFCKAGKKLSLSQKQDREIMIAKSREIIRKFFKEIKAENSGSSEEAANIQETDIRKENSSLLGIGYSAQSHAFSQVWYEHPHLVIKKNKPDYKKLPIFRGVRGNLDEEMRKFIFNNLQKGFSRRFFYKLFKRDVLLVFNQEITELVKLRKLKIENDQIISNIKKRKEFLIFSKLFYSRKRIQAIFLAHKNEYQENKDYQQELDTLYADAA